MHTHTHKPAALHKQLKSKTETYLINMSKLHFKWIVGKLNKNGLRAKRNGIMGTETTNKEKYIGADIWSST